MILIYKTNSGNFVSDLDIKKSFNIITGLDWEDNETKYLKFLDKLLKSSLTFIPSVSTDDLLCFQDIRLAIEKYQEIYSCSQETAKYMFSKLLSEKLANE